MIRPIFEFGSSLERKDPEPPNDDIAAAFFVFRRMVRGCKDVYQIEL